MSIEAIKREAKKNGVPLWLIADRMGISEASMTRLLRHELSREKEAVILGIIKEEGRKSHE